MKNKKVLITGGSGFFGNELNNFLITKYQDIINFDIVKPEFKKTNTTFIHGNILNFNEILEATKKVDTIFHNVANLPLSTNKSNYHSLNVQGTENILKAALQNKVRKIIYTSTGAVFGIPKTNPVLNTDSPKPREEYGFTKYLGEKVCQNFIKRGLSITIIRPNTILGTGRLGTLSLLYNWISEGYNIPVFSGGRNIYQFTHAKDLSRLCYLASLKKDSEIYNCGSKDNDNMFKVMTELCEFAGTKSKVKSIPMWPAIFLMNLFSFLRLSPLQSYHSLMYGRSLYFDMQKNKDQLDWRPEYSNFEMLKESYIWFLKEKDKNANLVKYNQPHQSMINEGILRFLKKIF